MHSMLRKGLALVSCFGLSAALAADGAWKFQLDRQDQPSLSYLDAQGKTVLYIGCGGHFVFDVVYPGATRKDGSKVSIAIANGTTTMTFAGEIDAAQTYAPPGAVTFSQADLGYARSDPDLYEKKWHAFEDKVFAFLDSSHPLTISAEGKSYLLPAIDAADWRARFRKIC